MANIWKQNKDVNNHPNRNNFDLSEQSHLTMKMGYLYPVYCRRVVPGDSFSIRTAFGLKFMPMVFPVQSRMRAHMHYFYVRNKNLWDNWENWISGLVSQDEHPHPFLQAPDKDVVKGSIHDFFNVPTGFIDKNETRASIPFDFRTQVDSRVLGGYAYHIRVFYGKVTGTRFVAYSDLYNSSISTAYVPIRPIDFSFADRDIAFSPGLLSLVKGAIGTASADLYLDVFTSPNLDFPDENNFSQFNLVASVAYVSGDSVNLTGTQSTDLQNLVSQGYKLFFTLRKAATSAVHPISISTVVSGSTSIIPLMIPNLVSNRATGYVQYRDFMLGAYTNGVRLNALPYRAYESIYYAYYANSVIQPLRDAYGNPVYNKYNHTTADGDDATDYHLFKRNYELDAYTSAMPSPQQGIAPLVGMTALGNITIEDENGITTAKAEVDSDGNISKVVLTSSAASVEHARTAMNIASSGLSINDFRATNALQRFLETSLRKGYRYMDFIAGHFGKSPEYRELDMPEFIGGFSRDVNVTTTFASADTYDPSTDTGANLGDYVGNASLYGGSNHAVRHYCDDYGYIIGIMCVTPTPAYSQILPKQMQAPNNYLDYFFPEFNQLGLQPITYEEMTPLQQYIKVSADPSRRSMQETFGYQRPYHDYVGSVDGVHGEFRGSMKDFLVNRQFSDSPQLSDDFLKIKPEEVNDIFVNMDPEEDTIIGQVVFDVKAKRPISRIVIPGLGR